MVFTFILDGMRRLSALHQTTVAISKHAGLSSSRKSVHWVDTPMDTVAPVEQPWAVSSSALLVLSPFGAYSHL